MCRSITTLYHCDPPANDDDIRAAALQFVRKISGYRVPSKGNEAAFNAAVDAIATTSGELLLALNSTAPLRKRDAHSHRVSREANPHASTTAGAKNETYHSA